MTELIEKLLYVGKSTKVVGGGRKFSYSAIVVVGNRNGLVGVGVGKAREAIEATKKAVENAKKNVVKIHLRNGVTVPHDVQTYFGSSKVIIRSAKPGTGIIASAYARAIFDLLGLKDVVSKMIGSTNPYTSVYVVLKALKMLTSPKEIAEKRGKKISEIF